MFSRRILGGSPDGYRLELRYRAGRSIEPRITDQDALLPSAYSLEVETSILDETITSVEWTDAEHLGTVVQRIRDCSVDPALVEETVEVSLHDVSEPLSPQGNYTILHAADPNKEVQVDLTVRRTKPRLKSIQLARQKDTTGTLTATAMRDVLGACDLESVLRLQCAEGMANVLQEDLVERLGRLRQLNMSNCGLSVLSPAIGQLTGLRELLLSHNKLTALPMTVGNLRRLQILAVDNNLLTTIPVALKNCSALREISLEHNKLTHAIIDLSGLSALRALHLYGNPLQFLPELTPCQQLRHLSLANVRITADMNYSQWQVEVTREYMSRGHQLAALFALIFRRSSCQHPVLAGALGRIAEDGANCELVWKEEGAIQQLVLMLLSDNETVLQQAGKTLSLLAKYNPAIADEIVDCDVLSACLTLITATRYTSQIAGLDLIGNLSFASESAALRLMTQDLLLAIQAVMGGGSDDVKAVALVALGNMAFCPDNRAVLSAANGIKQRTIRLALSEQGTVKRSVTAAAVRALAILGENEVVQEAVGRAPVSGRGLRVLCMDGGGMRGIATVRMLRELESRTGQRIADMFDLICGTSTGGIIAVSLAVRGFTLDQVDAIYKDLGKQVFSRPLVNAEQKESWRDSLYRVYKSGQQHVRVAVYGAKHDTQVFETLIKAMCSQPVQDYEVGERMIDTSVLGGPKCFVVATLASVTPAVPYIFRNYEFPPGSRELCEMMKCSNGTSKAQVWHAVRASSAAPYYLDDFTINTDRFQDGAAIANNPAIIAIQEARALWPDVPIDTIVSLGCGSTPVQKRERSVSAYFETGNVLIESACSVDRTDAALCTLLPLIPGIRYFRFNPVDFRCNVELDDIDPTNLCALEDATVDYITQCSNMFDEAAQVLAGDVQSDQPSPSPFTNRLGIRRGVLLVQCLRGSCVPGSAAGVNAVAKVVNSLPQHVCTMDLARLATADHALQDEPLLSPKDMATVFSDELASQLSAHHQRLGVVHLALHTDSHGPIISWKQQLHAVAEPSAEADRLCGMLPLDLADKSLVDAFAERPCLQFDDDSVTLLGESSQWAHGQRVTSLLLESTLPHMWLTPQAIGNVAESWRQLLVVASEPLPEAVVQALLEHGAKGVVCAREAPRCDASQETAALVASLFQGFYAALLTGADVPTALAAGYAAAPALRDQYCWYSSKGGRFLMHTLLQQHGSSRYNALVSKHWSWRDPTTREDDKPEQNQTSTKDTSAYKGLAPAAAVAAGVL